MLPAREPGNADDIKPVDLPRPPVTVDPRLGHPADLSSLGPCDRLQRTPEHYAQPRLYFDERHQPPLARYEIDFEPSHAEPMVKYGPARPLQVHLRDLLTLQPAHLTWVGPLRRIGANGHGITIPPTGRPAKPKNSLPVAKYTTPEQQPQPTWPTR